MNQPKDTLLINEGAWKAAGQDTFIRHRVVEIIAKDLVLEKRTLDPDGTGFLYWYVGLKGDTLALDNELTTFEYEMPILMKQPFRASDTIQPNQSQHGSPSAFVASYAKPHSYINPYDSFGVKVDYAYGTIIFLIALAYLVRCDKTKAWGMLLSELSDAWNPKKLQKVDRSV